MIWKVLCGLLGGLLLTLIGAIWHWLKEFNIFPA